MKLEIKKVNESKQHPYGLSFSFTMDRTVRLSLASTTLSAFPRKGRASKIRRWNLIPDTGRRTQSDPELPYVFKNAETLNNDFFDKVERVLTEHGIPFEVTRLWRGDRR